MAAVLKKIAADTGDDGETVASAEFKLREAGGLFLFLRLGRVGGARLPHDQTAATGGWHLSPSTSAAVGRGNRVD